MSRLILYIGLSVVLHLLAVFPLLAEQFAPALQGAAVAGQRSEPAVLALPKLVMPAAAPALDVQRTAVAESVDQPVAQVLQDQPQPVREVPAVAPVLQSKPAPVQATPPHQPAKSKALLAVEPVKRPERVQRQAVEVPAESAADALVESAPEPALPATAEVAALKPAQGDRAAAVDLPAHASVAEAVSTSTQKAVQSAPVAPAHSEVLSTEPRFARTPAPPVYPAQAKRRQQQGTVWVEVRLNAQGRQLAVQVLRTSGVPSLDKAALAAVRKWQFLPETHSGMGVPSRIHIPIEFAIAAHR